ncbi:hypothetical protein NIIDMKKI_10400 [Mycobacterium kansasii]|uniref:ATP-dependent DNA ligase family profile domain-containing protein n=1 Tax=Mycobacterium kansasii TaxID=1768 RepID=A0A7G1I5X3_MYCKA|nr:hypothetical protein NIIDMKKI_10400 [Mycobacterium kansasii]
MIVNLHGKRISGRYALIQTNGDQWLAHRMKEQQAFDFDTLAPMLTTHGSVDRLKAGQWAFEGKWDGYRLLVEADHGAVRLRSRSGRDVTKEYPQLRSLAADLADHHVVLDGEVVALDAAGVPSFNEMQNRVRATRIEFWAFDLLYLDGRSLLRAKYQDRRKLLETLGAAGHLTVPELLPGDGAEAMAYSRKRGWEGVIAKRRDSGYQPGRRSAAWIKDKHWNTQEVVIGGWRAGEGGRSSGIGSLLMGIPGPSGLHFAGRVGTGFTQRNLDSLKGRWRPCAPTKILSALRFRRVRLRASRSSSRRWSARCAIANGPPTIGCVKRVGVGCGRTRTRVRWCGNEVGDLPQRRRRTGRRALRRHDLCAATGIGAARPARRGRRRAAHGRRGRVAGTGCRRRSRRRVADGAHPAPAVDP